MNKAEKATVKAQFDDEKKCLEELKKAYKKAKKDVQAKLKALNSRTDMQNLQTIIHQRKYQEALLKQIDGVLNDLETHTYDSANEFFQGSYQNGYIGSMYELMNQGIPLTIPVSTQKMFRAIQTDSKLSTKYYLGKGLTVQNIRTLKKQIATEATRGIASGKSWLEVADDLTIQRYFQISQSDAIRIVRTEGNRINQQARLDAGDDAIQNGCDLLKQWDATLDSRTRQAHREADGQIVEWDEDFTVMGEKLKAPSIGGSASNVINCRCQLLKRPRWALDEEELEVLKKRADYYKLDKNQSFEEFKEKYLNLPDVIPAVVPDPVETLYDMEDRLDQLKSEEVDKTVELTKLKTKEKFGDYKEAKIDDLKRQYKDVADLTSDEIDELRELKGHVAEYRDKLNEASDALEEFKRLHPRPRMSDFPDTDEGYELYQKVRNEWGAQRELLKEANERYFDLYYEAQQASSKYADYENYIRELKRIEKNYVTHSELLDIIKDAQDEWNKAKKAVSDLEALISKHKLSMIRSSDFDPRNTTKKLEAFMDKDDYKAFMDIVSQNEDISVLYSCADKVTYFEHDSGCMYWDGHMTFNYPTQKYIDKGMSKYRTISHEFGHLFDREKYSGLTFNEVESIQANCKNSSYWFKKVASSSDKFLEATRKDLEYIVNNYAELNNYCCTNGRMHLTVGLQDFVDGTGAGTIAWGHGNNYYHRFYNDTVKSWNEEKELKKVYQSLGFDASNQTKVKRISRIYDTASELWANITCGFTVGGGELESLKKYAPNAVKAYMEIIKGYTP